MPRCPSPNLFANTNPNWSLANLDQNSGFFQTSFNDGSLGYINYTPTDTGTNVNYAISLAQGAPSAYQAGMHVSFIPGNTNIGPASLTVSPLGSTGISNPAGIALQGGEIVKNRRVDLVYDGSSFRIMGPCTLGLSFPTVTGNQLVVECAGYTAVSLYGGFSNASGIQLVLAHLGFGVPVTVGLVNSSAANSIFSFQPTDPLGTAYTHSYVVTATTQNPAGGQGGFTDMMTTAVPISAGFGIITSGASVYVPNSTTGMIIWS